MCPQKPAGVQGTNQSLGRGCFCFIVQIRVQLWKSPKYMTVENENTAEELGYGGLRRLCPKAGRMESNSRGARDPPQFLEGLASREPSAHGTRLFS